MGVCVYIYKERRIKKKKKYIYIIFRGISTIFPVPLAMVLQGGVRGGGTAKKGYRVLYAVVVRFIARSRFTLSFVYCIYIYYILTRQRPGLFVCSPPPASLWISLPLPPRLGHTIFSRVYLVLGARIGRIRMGVFSIARVRNYTPSSPLVTFTSTLVVSPTVYTHTHTHPFINIYIYDIRRGARDFKRPPLSSSSSFGIRSIKQDVAVVVIVVVLLFSTPFHSLFLRPRRYLSLATRRQRSGRDIRGGWPAGYCFLDLSWILHRAVIPRLCLFRSYVPPIRLTFYRCPCVENTHGQVRRSGAGGEGDEREKHERLAPARGGYSCRGGGEETVRTVVCFVHMRSVGGLSITPRPEGTAGKAIVISPKAASYTHIHVYVSLKPFLDPDRYTKPSFRCSNISRL